MRFGFPTGGSDPVCKWNSVVKRRVSSSYDQMPALCREEEEEEALKCCSVLLQSALWMLLSACLFYCLMAAPVAFTLGCALGTMMEQRCPSEGPRSFPAKASRISQAASKQQERNLCRECQETRSKERSNNKWRWHLSPSPGRVL